MYFPTGFRTYTTFNYTTAGTLQTVDDKGSYIYAEVTAGSTDITFSPNQYLGIPDGGGILIKANTTRIIPLILYNFTATGACTVVAYRM